MLQPHSAGTATTGTRGKEQGFADGVGSWAVPAPCPGSPRFPRADPRVCSQPDRAALRREASGGAQRLNNVNKKANEESPAQLAVFRLTWMGVPACSLQSLGVWSRRYCNTSSLSTLVFVPSLPFAVGAERGAMLAGEISMEMPLHVTQPISPGNPISPGSIPLETWHPGLSSGPPCGSAAVSRPHSPVNVAAAGRTDLYPCGSCALGLLQGWVAKHEDSQANLASCCCWWPRMDA